MSNTRFSMIGADYALSYKYDCDQTKDTTIMMLDVCISTSIWLAFALVSLGLIFISFLPFALQDCIKIENYLKCIFVVINIFVFLFLLINIVLWKYLGHETINDFFVAELTGFTPTTPFVYSKLGISYYFM